MSPSPFRPTMRRLAAVQANPATMKMSVSRAPNMIIPSLVVIGAVYGVAAYVRSQLMKESNTMNRMFAQQNTPEVEAARKKNLLVETEGDPRKSVFNILNW